MAGKNAPLKPVCKVDPYHVHGAVFSLPAGKCMLDRAARPAIAV